LQASQASGLLRQRVEGALEDVETALETLGRDAGL
jgi:hypothetical protein